jgi:hypothetical protein
MSDYGVTVYSIVCPSRDSATYEPEGTVEYHNGVIRTITWAEGRKTVTWDRRNVRP